MTDNHAYLAWRSTRLSYIAFGNEIVDWNSQSETLNQISTELPIALESTVLLNNVSDVTKNEQSDLFNADANYITAGSTSLSETSTTEASPTEISKNDHEIPNNNLIETDENSKTLQVSVSAAVESMIHCTESGCTSNDGTILSSKLEDGTRIYIQSL